MKTLKQNPKTGIVEVWEDGVKVGEVITMGDNVNGKNDNSGRQHPKG